MSDQRRLLTDADVAAFMHAADTRPDPSTGFTPVPGSTGHVNLWGFVANLYQTSPRHRRRLRKLMKELTWLVGEAQQRGIAIG